MIDTNLSPLGFITLRTSPHCPHEEMLGISFYALAHRAHLVCATLSRSAHIVQAILVTNATAYTL